MYRTETQPCFPFSVSKSQVNAFLRDTTLIEDRDLSFEVYLVSIQCIQVQMEVNMSRAFLIFAVNIILNQELWLILTLKLQYSTYLQKITVMIHKTIFSVKGRGGRQEMSRYMSFISYLYVLGGSSTVMGPHLSSLYIYQVGFRIFLDYVHLLTPHLASSMCPQLCC